MRRRIHADEEENTPLIVVLAGSPAFSFFWICFFESLDFAFGWSLSFLYMHMRRRIHAYEEENTCI
jgi:hypothetical protein